MRGYNIDEYIGKKFNSLTLIKNLNKIDKRNSKLALFKCDCGNEKELNFTEVLHGYIKTCGCKQGYLDKEARSRQQQTIKKFYSNNTMKNNKTGRTGISIVNNKYRVRIQKNKKTIHIGYFDTLEKAIYEREKAELKYFRADT